MSESGSTRNERTRALLAGFGVAVAGAAAAFLIRRALDPYLGPRDLSFPLYIPPVVGAAAIGGV
jgi:hypothetical protein